MDPKLCFSPGTTPLISWPNGERYSRPLHFLVVSLLLLLVSTLVFSWTGCILSHVNSSTQISSVSTEELVHFRLRCDEYSLLLSLSLTKIDKIENPSCSACGHLSQGTSHLILHCPATDPLRHLLFGDFLFTTSGPGPGASWSSAMRPSFKKGRVKTTISMEEFNHRSNISLHHITSNLMIYFLYAFCNVLLTLNYVYIVFKHLSYF